VAGVFHRGDCADALARLALLRLRVKAALPMLIYPSLVALFTFMLWLIFFY